MLQNSWLRLALAVATLFMATFGAVLYFLSIFFQNVLRYDALETGLAFLLPTAVVVGSSTLAGRKNDGYRARCLLESPSRLFGSGR
jgi:hypothetical protein